MSKVLRKKPPTKGQILVKLFQSQQTKIQRHASISPLYNSSHLIAYTRESLEDGEGQNECEVSIQNVS